jgi:uncharacterized membrane protein
MWKQLTPLRKVQVALLAVFATWLALTLLAPLTLPSGSVLDLSGSVGRIDNLPQIEKMNPLAAFVYLVGDVNCHQIVDRSFTINGNEMPFCARDTGIFFGLVLGMAMAATLRFRPSAMLVALGFVPTALDGGLQLVTSYTSNNLLRVATGLIAGVAAAYLLVLLARRFLEADARSR